MADESGGGLSLAVRLGALNDFLEPSQECVVDLEKPKLIKLKGSSQNKTSGVVNVGDCLACSGCVTTAEAVLLNTHNYSAFRDRILENRSSKSEGRKLPTRIVISLTAVSEATILANFNFHNRAHLYGILHTLLPEAEIICSCDLAEQLANEDGLREENVLRPISAHCPSVVLYAEKFEHHVIPYIDLIPPVQCWQGAIVKHLLGPTLGISFDENLYHIVVNSCADKKLEVFRPEFQGLVDLSLTTDEFMEALRELGFSDDLIRDGSDQSLGAPLRDWELSARLAKFFGFQFLQRYHIQRSCGPLVARELERRSNENLEVKIGANADNVIWEGTRLSSANGLRNLKNTMARHRMKNLEEDGCRLDLMACPKGGCFSGAGHTHIYKAGQSVRTKAEELFSSMPRYGCLRPQAAIALIRRQREGVFTYNLKESSAPTNVMNNW